LPICRTYSFIFDTSKAISPSSLQVSDIEYDYKHDQHCGHCPSLMVVVVVVVVIVTTAAATETVAEEEGEEEEKHEQQQC